nr:MAG TPA: Major capsid protein [Caudoviricetes sp.]
MYRIKSLYDNIMEIKAFGDKVRISLPNADNVTVAITAGTTEVCPVPGKVSPTQKTLEINNIATFSLKFSDVDQVQSQYNLLDGYSAIAMQKLGDLKDKQVMVALIKAVTNANNMIGTAAAPQAVTKDDIYDYLVDARVALTNAGALNGNGFYSFKGNQEEMEFLAPVYTCTPKIFGLMLKSTQLTHPTANADQVIERGQKSMMAGFEIDQDTVLTTITDTEVKGLAEGAQIGIAATKMAVTYANQYTKVEKLRDPDCFADIVRGLELYGFAVIHPECAVITYFTLA